MWTMKAATLASAGVLSGVAGFMLRDFQLLVLGVMFISFLALNAFFRPRIEVERPIPYYKVFEGDLVDLYAYVRNAGARSALLEVYDSVPTQMRIAAGDNSILAHLSPGEEAAMAYTVETPLRGHYVFGPVMVRRRDYSFLFFDEERLVERGYLSVYPRLEEIHTLPIRSRYMIPYFGTIGCRQAGLGSEFYYIRDYVMGDAFKRINWKASVRHQKWLVNEYEKENLCDVMVFVDAREVTGKGSPLRNPLEYSVKAAVSISTHLLKSRNEVGLVTYNDEVKAIFPSIGERQVQIITSALVGTYARGDIPLMTAVELALPHLHPRCTVFVISSLDEDPTLVKAVQLMRDRNYEVVMLTPALLDIERDLIEGHFGIRSQMIQQERDNLISELRARGAVVMDWDYKQPLYRVLDKGGLAG
jgi:uncharacterized protein (DUF58 family)